uniref:C2H2-type domain-containing protein n=1 Tax=Trichogramma kaykai TaxID=54128 RepID=A0ABD2X3M0_9HYME
MTKTRTRTITRWRCDTMLRLRETRSCLYNRRGEFLGYIDVARLINPRSRDPLENLKILRKSSLRLEEVRSICSTASQRVSHAPKAIGSDHRCHVRAAQQHHRTVHEGRKDFECDKCGKIFGFRWSWLMHIKTVHENCKDYACDKCEKKFGQKFILNLHQRTVHEGRQDFACDKCQKKFAERSNLIKHQITIHEGRKDYACDKCEQKLGQKTHLLLHQKTVHECRKDYSCDDCESKFRSRGDLFRHQKTVHEGRKDYACDKCEQKLGQKTHLLLHQKTVHECRKDYSCDDCESKFRSRGDLFRHQKTVHEGRKDYACDKCGKKFGQKSHLLVDAFFVARSASPREDRIGPREQRGETKERGKNYQKKIELHHCRARAQDPSDATGCLGYTLFFLFRCKRAYLFDLFGFRH